MGGRFVVGRWSKEDYLVGERIGSRKKSCIKPAARHEGVPIAGGKLGSRKRFVNEMEGFEVHLDRVGAVDRKVGIGKYEEESGSSKKSE